MSEHRRNISFQTTDGVTLKGWFFPASSGRNPCVILTHGISALKEHFIDQTALELRRQGFNALLYDNRGFGESGGRRFDVDPIRAQDDYVDAFDYAASLPEVDPERIVFWGVSLSGGVAISAAAIDRRVKAVVAVVPFVSGELLMCTGHSILDMAQRDRAKILKGEDWPLTGVIASTLEEAEAGTAPVILRDAVSYRFFQRAAAQGGHWENKITTMSLFRLLRFEPIRYVHRVAPTPLLMIVGEKDETLLSPQLQAFGLAREPKYLHILKGGDHFNHYQGEIGAESLGVQVEFLKRYV
ncbi:alpha/beta-hydrolase [Trichoderma longibrachiatum ATCC 18648]|uniref:Alpha/beta-hydrolase n=1 Tax=Trichoderma longibrachiatum ATCC 18648 TaxID=983965 RepID=A0A2T4CBI2_TRILO|nr:alpha/beta-hydrolase [Trichoderma longibrachiatum ATCC 18648]